jgi:hypothetical protein
LCDVTGPPTTTLQTHVPVVDQHLVPGPQHLTDRRGRDRQLAVDAVWADDDGDPVACRELHRRGEVADADLRALQVADQRDRPAGALLRLADERRAVAMVVVRPVREVEPGRIHAGCDERVELVGRRARRPDRGDDLRAPRAP